MKPDKTDQPGAETGAEAARHIGGAAGNPKERAEGGEALAAGLVRDPSKGSTPKDGGAKSGAA